MAYSITVFFSSMSTFVKFFSTLKNSRNIAESLLKHSCHFNTQASKFTINDMKALRVNFQSASEDFVIPNEKIEDFPENYICPKIIETCSVKQNSKLKK